MGVSDLYKTLLLLCSFGRSEHFTKFELLYTLDLNKRQIKLQRERGIERKTERESKSKNLGIVALLSSPSLIFSFIHSHTHARTHTHTHTHTISLSLFLTCVWSFRCLSIHCASCTLVHRCIMMRSVHPLP